MILVIGEILFDLFPTYKRIGGAPFNFAVHLKQLGFDVRFVSGVGRDDLGRQILDFIVQHGFDPTHIQINETLPTGQVQVNMAADGSHSFSIIQNTAYDQIELKGRLKALCGSRPEMVYFGTLTQRTLPGHNLIKAVLDRLPPETLKFCDINLRPGCWTRPVVDQSVANADILKLSHEELDVLVSDKNHSLEVRSATLLKKPGPKQIILTRGEKGSIWLSSKGVSHGRADEKRSLKIADTVGAGDAYAAMAAATQLSGIGNEQAMTMAHEFAAGICEIQGAIPQDPAFYTPFLSSFHKVSS